MDEISLNKSLLSQSYIQKMIFFDEIDSTNNYAKLQEQHSDTLVVADHQSGGKGRFNRPWISSRGEDITITLVKKIKLSIDVIQYVNFYVSFVLAKTIIEIFGFKNNELSLKWPNDIILNGKKICGILTEVKDLQSEEKIFFIGIGLNVNRTVIPESLKTKATSLFLETGTRIHRENIILNFVKNFYTYLDMIYNHEILLSNWKKHSKMIGKNVNFRIHDDSKPSKGQVIDVMSDGALLMGFEDGCKRKFYSGEIIMEDGSIF